MSDWGIKQDGFPIAKPYKISTTSHKLLIMLRICLLVLVLDKSLVGTFLGNGKRFFFPSHLLKMANWSLLRLLLFLFFSTHLLGWDKEHKNSAPRNGWSKLATKTLTTASPVFEHIHGKRYTSICLYIASEDIRILMSNLLSLSLLGNITETLNSMIHKNIELLA